MYKLVVNEKNITVGVMTESLSIPFDPANTDYQAYLAWLAEGNTPLPADEVTE